MQEKLKKMARRFIILTLATGFCAGAPSFAQPDSSQEISQYIQIMQEGSLAHKIITVKKITNSGLSDTQLFDVLEKELKDGFLTATGKDPMDYMAWLCKALASSGQEKYKATLTHVVDNTPDPKLKRYAEQSLALFEQYAARNKIMNQGSAGMADKDPAVVQLINMLKSAAKKITRSTYKDPDLYETVNQELLNGYANASDKLSVDAMAWLCKALGSSGNANYKPTLQKVMDSGNPLLVKYATQSFEMLY